MIVFLWFLISLKSWIRIRNTVLYCCLTPGTTVADPDKGPPDPNPKKKLEPDPTVNKKPEPTLEIDVIKFHLNCCLKIILKIHVSREARSSIVNMNVWTGSRSELSLHYGSNSTTPPGTLCHSSFLLKILK